jgi:hypothetical protein
MSPAVQKLSSFNKLIPMIRNKFLMVIMNKIKQIFQV